MYSTLTQGDIGRAGVANQSEQLRASAVNQQNANTLGLAGLGLQAQGLAQTGAFQTKQLAAMEKRYAALDKQSQARMAQVRAGAMSKFMETQGGQLNAQLAKEYGPNWRTSSDPRSLQAQMLFKQAQNAYIMDALGQYETTASARDSSEL
jgi:transposase